MAVERASRPDERRVLATLDVLAREPARLGLGDPPSSSSRGDGLTPAGPRRRVEACAEIAFPAPGP